MRLQREKEEYTVKLCKNGREDGIGGGGERGGELITVNGPTCATDGYNGTSLWYSCSIHSFSVSGSTLSVSLATQSAWPPTMKGTVSPCIKTNLFQRLTRKNVSLALSVYHLSCHCYYFDLYLNSVYDHVPCHAHLLYLHVHSLHSSLSLVVLL